MKALLNRLYGGLRFTWQGTARQGRLVSRLIHLDTAEGPWLSRLEVLL